MNRLTDTEVARQLETNFIGSRKYRWLANSFRIVVFLVMMAWFIANWVARIKNKANCD